MLGFLPRMPAVRAAATGVSALLARQGFAVEAAPALALAIAEIDSAETFEAISTPASDLVANGRIAKFLIDRRRPAGAGDPVRQRELHRQLRRGARRGEVPLLLRPGRVQRARVAGRVQPADLLRPGQALHRRLGAHLLPGRDPPSRSTACSSTRRTSRASRRCSRRSESWLARSPFPTPGWPSCPAGPSRPLPRWPTTSTPLGVEVIPLDRILGSIVYLPLNVGEAWGHLRIFPTDNDELRATDIPIFDELPLDLSVVAGTMTRAVQDTNSHVNLKSKERGTPNAVLRDAGPDHPRLAPFADQPVHLVVGRDDFTIEPTTEEVVAAKLAEKLDRPLTRAGVGRRDRRCAPTPRWPPAPRARPWRSMPATAARPPTSASSPTATCWARWMILVARARSAATTWCPTASACRSRRTRTSSPTRRTPTSGP